MFLKKKKNGSDQYKSIQQLISEKAAREQKTLWPASASQKPTALRHCIKVMLCPVFPDQINSDA